MAENRKMTKNREMAEQRGEFLSVKFENEQNRSIDSIVNRLKKMKCLSHK